MTHKKNYLSLANKIFKLNKNICGIGAPLHQKIAQFFKNFWICFLSKFSGGFPERYINIGKIKKIYDWPSVNLMVKKILFKSWWF